MPENYFKKNRSRIKKSFLELDFLIPLTNDNVPYLIEEKNNKGRANDTLRLVRIHNIPVSNEREPISYILDLEITKQLFSCPPYFSTVEKAVLMLSKNVLYITLLEMKSTLISDEIGRIEKKIRDSVGRLSLFLTHYLLDDILFDNCEIKFSAVILYNTDELTKNVNPPKETPILSYDLVKIFKGAKDHYFVTEPLGQVLKIDVFFKHNPENSQEFNFDFRELFAGNPDYDNAIVDIRTLP